MVRTYLAAGFALVALSTGAAQAETTIEGTGFSLPTERAQAVLGRADWTGFYAGAQLGYGRVDNPFRQ